MVAIKTWSVLGLFLCFIVFLCSQMKPDIPAVSHTTIDKESKKSNQSIAKIVVAMKAHRVRQTIETKCYNDGKGGERIVFLDHNKRYTMFWVPENKVTTPYISMWVRKNGTHGQESIESCTDDALDGTVDFGIAGTGSRRRIYSSGAQYPKTGEQHRAYFQKRYNESIAAAHRHL